MKQFSKQFRNVLTIFIRVSSTVGLANIQYIYIWGVHLYRCLFHKNVHLEMDDLGLSLKFRGMLTSGNEMFGIYGDFSIFQWQKLRITWSKHVDFTVEKDGIYFGHQLIQLSHQPL